MKEGRKRITYTVPCASTAVVGALIASELVDHDTGVVVVVFGASATTGLAAWSRRWAVRLIDVLKSARLN